MANEDIIFRAGFEYDEVVAGLTRIGQTAQQAAASSSASLALLGRASLDVAAAWGAQYDAVSKQILVERMAFNAGEEFSDTRIENLQASIVEEKRLAKAIMDTKTVLDTRIAAAARAPDTPRENIRTPAGSVSLGDQLGAGTMASRGQLSLLGDTAAAKADLERLGDVIDEMFNRGEIRAKQFAGVFHTIATSLAGELHGQDLSNALKPLENQAKRILAMFKSGDFDFSKDMNVDTMIAQMNELRAVASEFLNSSSEEAQQFGATMLANLDKADDGLTNVHKDADVFRKDLKAITGELKQATGASTELEEQLGAIGKLPLDLQKKIKAKMVEVEVKRLENAIKKLSKSTSVEANKAGKEFEEMGEEIKEAFDPDESVGETLKALREVTAGANKAGHAFDENFGKLERAAGNAGPPIWKLGTAMDRVGIRGAGGILRVVDAVKEMGPAFIAAGIAAAGFALIITKLIGLAVELGKKFAAAFLEFTKASVDAAKQIQHLDAQFSGLLKDTSGKLGKALRNFVLEQSLEFGVELTGDFANILVPLAKDTDQIRQMAEDVAAISHLRGIAVENIVNAVKQATGGHFRPFQQTLGMTPQEVDRVQELQEAYGQLTGTLMGLEEFMDRRGINFAALGNSLSVAQGKLVAFGTQIKIATGQPIRDTLGKEFNELLDIIEQNRAKILQFADTIGDAVAGVLGNLGDLFGDWIDSIDPGDIRDVEKAIEDLEESVNFFIDTMGEITDDDVNTLKDAFIGLTGVVGTLTEDVSVLVLLLDKVSDFFSAEIREGYTLLQLLSDIAEAPYDPTSVIDAGFKSQQDALRNFADEYGLTIDEQNIISKFFDFQGLPVEFREAGREAGEAFSEGFLGPGEERFIGYIPPREQTQSELEAIDMQLQFNQNEIDLAAINAAIEEIEESLDTVKIGMEFDQKEAKIFVDEADKLLKKEIDFSIKRRDATIKYLNSQRDARIQYGIDEAEAIENADEKTVDIFQKFRDKEEDIDEDRAKKRIKIEEKLQEKLRDIRAKFNFDAAEAIRMNDAVALLRIRRRMAFELAQAKLKNKEDVEKNDETAEEKREDNRKWLRRQVRDADLAEKRKLEDLAQRYEEKKTAMDQQYDDELHMLALHEQDKEEEIAQWRIDALRDLDTWHDNKMAMMDEQNKEEITKLRKHENKKREIILENMHLANQQQYDPVAWGQSSTNLYGINTPGAITNYGGYIGNKPIYPPGGQPTQPTQPTQPPGPHPHDAHPPPPPTPLQSVTPPNPMVPDQILEQMRKEAIRIATKAGLFTMVDFLEKVSSYASLKMNLEYLKTNYPGYERGGIAPAGRGAIVGEKGPEPIMPVSAGIIAPHAPLDYSPGVTNTGQTINDNSQNVSADLSMLDPSQISPMQQTIIRSIITDEILSLGVG